MIRRDARARSDAVMDMRALLALTLRFVIFVEESVIYPIHGEGNRMINYVAIGRDITQEREIEKHLRQQQKMNAIGVLAGGVSHDFNNILTAILGYVALCMNTVEEDSKVYGYLKEIVKNARNLVEIGDTRSLVKRHSDDQIVFIVGFIGDFIDDQTIEAGAYRSVKVQL